MSRENTKLNNGGQYDLIADVYDDLFKDEYSVRENAEVLSMLGEFRGSFLDVGCGTGLLLDIKRITPENYLGVDPSSGMLRNLSRKHPTHKTICASYDPRDISPSSFDNVVSLFGAPSYLCDDVLQEIAKSECQKFLMFYREGYHPVTYEKCNVSFLHYTHKKAELEQLFKDCEAFYFHNYIIITSKQRTHD